MDPFFRNTLIMIVLGVVSFGYIYNSATSYSNKIGVSHQSQRTAGSSYIRGGVYYYYGSRSVREGSTGGIRRRGLAGFPGK
jgi:hypothetical protein